MVNEKASQENTDSNNGVRRILILYLSKTEVHRIDERCTSVNLILLVEFGSYPSCSSCYF